MQQYKQKQKQNKTISANQYKYATMQTKAKTKQNKTKQNKTKQNKTTCSINNQTISQHWQNKTICNKINKKPCQLNTGIRNHAIIAGIRNHAR